MIYTNKGMLLATLSHVLCCDWLHRTKSLCAVVPSVRLSSKGLIPRAVFLGEMRIISPVSFELRLLE